LIIFIALSLVIIYFYFPDEEKILYQGSMLVNDSGEPKGGFEWVGIYNLTLTNKYLRVTLLIGLGDPLDKHNYEAKVIEFVEKSYLLIAIKCPRNNSWVKINLSYVEEDLIWGEFNKYYIAYYVDPTIFDGFASHYYVEMRLKPYVS